MLISENMQEVRDQVPVCYRMFDELQIKNYRCFREVKLSHLPMINLIVGDNSSGKTALLEAIFLMSGSNPELPLRTSVWRGVLEDPNFLPADLEQLRNTWTEFFSDLNINNTIYISGRDTEQGLRELSISFQPQPPFPLEGSKNISFLPTSLSCQWNMAGRIHEVVIEAGKAKASGQASLIPIVFINPGLPNPRNDTDRFSQLSKTKRTPQLVAALQQEFPYLLNLGIEQRLDRARITADISYLPETIPVGAVSSGFKKLLNVLLAIAASPGGVVLIDELENGLYYERLPRVWQLIREWANTYQTQLFISTHSEECLKAMSNTLNEHASEFSLLRVVKDDGASIIRFYDGNQLKRNLESNTELR